jgi:ribonucleoside-diphosphate reductase alpha chain
MVKEVIKRNGSRMDFNSDKITEAVFKAANSVGGSDRTVAEKITSQVEEILEKRFIDKTPEVEEIQDVVEEVLIKKGHDKTAKAYILYRAKRAELRAAAAEAERSMDKEGAALMHMFAHKSKLASMVGYDRLEAYKNMLFYLKNLQKIGKLPVSENYLAGNELATKMYRRKYYMKDLENKLIDKKPEDVFSRLAAFMASVEETEDKQKEWAEKYYISLYEGCFLPGGRVIAGGGDLYRLKTLANCFVSAIDEDNIESIYKTAYECARTYSYGGGIGVDISSLRPKDSIVHNAADASTGAVSFMEIFSLTTGLIGQSGRRGALMLTIDVKHPDSPLFVNVKKIPNWVTNQIVQQCKWTGSFTDQQLELIKQQVRENIQVRFANISLKVSDEFMHAVDEQNKYNKKILVYKKSQEVSSLSVSQAGSVHYSYGIPSKPIDKYELLHVFDTLDELNLFLKEKNSKPLSESILDDVKSRDMFGDFLVNGRDDEFAIKRSGDFMLYFKSPETGEVKRLVKARELWNSFIEGNYKTAEPGLIFWTTMSKYSPSNYVGRPILSTNPCGEVPLEDGGACNLASINLSRFVKNGYTKSAEIDWAGIKENVELVVRFLDSVVIWNEQLNPLEKQRKAARETRRLGLGVMGISDMLNQLGLGYDSEEGIKILEEIAKSICNTAYQASARLAEEKGISSIFDYKSYSKGAFFQEALSSETRKMIKEKGLRNIAILSIAPTGTISNVILGYRIGMKNFIGVSGGIEPIFALYYTRRSESMANQFFKVFHSTVDAYLHQTGKKSEAEQCKTDSELESILPDHFFRTAHNIDPEKRVRIQGIWQKYIDHSISSTINLPEEINPETISDIYLNAWKYRLKGITIYRAGSRYPILSTEGRKTEFQELKEKEFEIEVSGEKKKLKGGEIITLDNGKLTTVYHAVSGGTISKGIVTV